jgi:hypothetical protein
MLSVILNFEGRRDVFSLIWEVFWGFFEVSSRLDVGRRFFFLHR